jgi:hypothetical protein
MFLRNDAVDNIIIIRARRTAIEFDFGTARRERKNISEISRGMELT